MPGFVEINFDFSEYSSFLAKKKFPPSFWDSTNRNRPPLCGHNSGISNSANPFFFYSNPTLPLSGFPRQIIGGDFSFLSPTVNFLSKLSFLRSSNNFSLFSNRFHPIFNAKNLRESWQPYPRLSDSFTGQNFQAPRSFSSALGATYSIPDLFGMATPNKISSEQEVGPIASQLSHNSFILWSENCGNNPLWNRGSVSGRIIANLEEKLKPQQFLPLNVSTT